jgi:predicted DCC family thiol-disulfide oxidoreductase YuxK
MSDERPAILFDAECNLCRGAVSFVRRRDHASRFRFVPLGSDAAVDLLPDGNCGCDTIHLIDAAGHSDRSTAVLRIAAGLGRPWSFLRFLRILPRGLRDSVYNFVARHRISWFGRPEQNACRRD